MSLNFQVLIKSQRDFFNTGASKSLDFRKTQLNRLKDLIVENQTELCEAIYQDLNKSAEEFNLTELGVVLHEIDYFLENLDNLIKPKMVDTPAMIEAVSGSRITSQIIYEPYGVVLNIAPWNYPVQLALAPIVGAIASGSTIILKPSEFTVQTSKLLADLVARYFEPAFFTVVLGDNLVNQALLAEKFDYVFFTGSVPVGKVVMRAVAEHLTPITLELGGKSPLIVDETADLALTAQKIVFGKTVNSGQTCVAPDYLLVQENVKNSLIQEISNVINATYQGNKPSDLPNTVKAVTPRHYERLKAFLQDGEVVIGGDFNDNTHKIGFTLLDGVTWDSPVMNDEIFGAILPMMTFKQLDEAISQIKARPKPLALYVFTQNKSNENQVLEQISFGGGCVNDVLFHVGNNFLPFGGVGESGMGAYHGEHSFYTFSHSKGVQMRI